MDVHCSRYISQTITCPQKHDCYVCICIHIYIYIYVSLSTPQKSLRTLASCSGGCSLASPVGSVAFRIGDFPSESWIPLQTKGFRFLNKGFPLLNKGFPFPNKGFPLSNKGSPSSDGSAASPADPRLELAAALPRRVLCYCYCYYRYYYY